MKRKNIITAGILIIAFFVPGISIASSGGPGELVVATIDKGLKILNDPGLQGIDHFKERKQEIWRAVEPVFDFEETSKRALGRQWASLNAEEKKEFTEEFVNVLKNIYLGKTDSYQGEKIEYVRELVEGKRARVQTNFFTVDQKKIEVDFNMHNVKGVWKIYDIVIEGVSIVSNYRGQFNSIISRGSFEELMEKLREKNEKIVH